MKTIPRRARLRTAAAGAVAAVALSLAGPLALASPAMAEGDPTGFLASNGSDAFFSPETCAGSSDVFRFRFYYHTGYRGAWVNVGHNFSDLTSFYVSDGMSYASLNFCDGTGDGAGQGAGNNSASAYNWYNGYKANVYYSHNYTGSYETFYPNSGRDLGVTRNNNRSIEFFQN
ncbi:hypothetical protein ACFYNO_02055 [Kitasatospora sp. NPDC006697]|uniref:hypothetical protein n=1 Tax=Kitasatospora sp. NPDC006697 TaxID=3364020 RepID=UPI00369005CD